MDLTRGRTALHGQYFSCEMTSLFLFMRVMQAQPQRRHIITFCHAMDQMLGGGVAVGEVTEFCGVPGERICYSFTSLETGTCIFSEQVPFGNSASI